MLTINNLKQLKESGKIKGYITSGNVSANIREFNSKAQPKGISFIEKTLKESGLTYVKEYKFNTMRKFRFDFAIPLKMIAVEYEGLVSTGKKGGHQTKNGYSINCEKYNLALINGWKVLRYTATNYKQFVDDLRLLMINEAGK